MKPQLSSALRLRDVVDEVSPTKLLLERVPHLIERNEAEDRQKLLQR